MMRLPVALQWRPTGDSGRVGSGPVSSTVQNSRFLTEIFRGVPQFLLKYAMRPQSLPSSLISIHHSLLIPKLDVT
jgi:hypothetical protein